MVDLPAIQFWSWVSQLHSFVAQQEVLSSGDLGSWISYQKLEQPIH